MNLEQVWAISDLFSRSAKSLRLGKQGQPGIIGHAGHEMSMAVDEPGQKSGIAQIHDFRLSWNFHGRSRRRNLVTLNQNHGITNHAAAVHIQHSGRTKRDYFRGRILLCASAHAPEQRARLRNMARLGDIKPLPRTVAGVIDRSP
jgi:hypothetical protein